MQSALKKIFEGIDDLKKEYKKRQFTIDGRLVGDIGEIIGEINYELLLCKGNQAHHDATAFDGRKVQIKATFQNSLTFKNGCDYYLGFKLFPDGEYEEIYNGPASVISEWYTNRGYCAPESLRSIRLATLRELSKKVQDKGRISKRQK